MSIGLHNLTIRYGEHTAVAGLSTVVGNGATGLLGRNGAGKSSVLRALLGLVQPVEGKIVFSDLPDTASSGEIRSYLGYMPERDAHLPQLTGLNMVALLGMLSGMGRQDAMRRSHEVLYLVGLEEQRYRQVSGYSTGMRQKAKLAAALVHDPTVLLLDEPTNGLDPAGRAEMLGLIQHLCSNLRKSVVLCTHIMQDVEAVCDEVIVLDAGRVVAQGGMRELVGRPLAAFELDVVPRTDSVRTELARLGQLEGDSRGRWILRPNQGVGTQAVFAAVLAAGAVVRSVQPMRGTLEDVFLRAIDPGHATGAEPKPLRGADHG